MKILFVDDSKTVCAVYVSLLTENGYKVHVAHSMEEAITVARSSGLRVKRRCRQ